MLQAIGDSQKPIKICVGTMQKFGPVKTSKPDPEKPNKTLYQMNEVFLNGASGSPDSKFRFMYLANWFNPRFNIRGMSEGEKFVYGTNINSLSGTSFLKGLCGSVESWEDFQSQVGQLDAYDNDTVDDFLRQFLLSLGPVPLVYELRQERKNLGVDSDNKRIYQLGRYYEVDSINWLTESYCKGLAKRIEKNRELIKTRTELHDYWLANGADPDKQPKPAPVPVLVAFEPESYGIDVTLPQVEEADWVTA